MREPSFFYEQIGVLFVFERKWDMQIKKDYTREQILAAAKKAFLKNGFLKTTTRDIAKGAGIGLSNIYNYFRSKDEMFCHIVRPLIVEMERMVAEHHNEKYQEQFLKYASGESDEMMTEHVQAYLRLIYHYREELELILFKAQGSSLENFIDAYTDVCTRQVLEFMNDFKQKNLGFSSVSSTFTYHVHTVWMFSFITEVIKHRLSRQEIEKAIEDYIQFEYSGWRALMNKK